MRQITTHLADPNDVGLKIQAVGPVNKGGDQSRYEINDINVHTNPAYRHGGEADAVIVFQNGPVPEVGINGFTIEALLAIGADRLTCLQDGPFRSDENGEALAHINKAIEALHKRTRNRITREVKDTYVP